MAYTPTIWQDGVTPVNAANLNKLENGLAAAVGIPADVVVTPGTAGLIRNRYSAADTQPAFQVRADGRMDWGVGGATAPDVALYRSSGTLRTDSGFQIAAGQFTMQGSYLYTAAIVGMDRAPASLAVEIYNTPDTDSKMSIRGDGKIEWGTGMAAKDTNLYRVGANMLGTDSGFYVGGQFQTNGIIGMGASSFLYSGSSPLGNGVVLSRAPGDVDNRFTLSNDGHMYFGGGAAGPDTQLYRAGVGVLQTDTLFKSAQDIWARAGTAQQVVIGNMGGNAGIYFSNLADVNLARVGATSLQTNAEMQAQGFRSLASANGAVAFVTSTLPADGSGYLIISQQTGDAHWRVLVNASGYITWGAGNVPGDTSLYRSGAGELTTGGKFVVGTNIYVGNDVVVDNANAGKKLYFGSALDTSLYRWVAGYLRTPGHFVVDGETYLAYANLGSGKVWIGFPLDTNLYRGGVGVLKTDGQIEVGATGVKFSDGSVQTKAGGGVLLRSTTLAQFSNDTVEHSMVTHTIPLGAVGPNSILRFVVNGSFRSQSTSDNIITYRIKVGGVTVWASQGVTYNNGAGTPDGEIFIEFFIQFLGATNLWMLYGIIGASRDTAATQVAIGKPSGSAMSPFSTGIADQTVNFSAAAIPVELTMQMSSGNNNNIVRHRSSFVELL